MTNTKQTGDETEARIIAALIEAGYSTAIPFGDNDRYDLVLDTGDELLRVQCKTGWIEDDVIRFKTASKTTVDGVATMNDYDSTIDAFAVRCKNTDALYWVPVEDAGKKSTYLRITEPEIDHPNVKMAETYRFDERLS
ncbi:group I intron-associated PD-(D/E)XK endonuclease [Natronorubrum sp. FCH18a]|uniref:group I intron-associated PD-(D/E)XK endonuclease n=1 Tax=Natronorubrum sp. FCH18a TaxID=3447018 RepID=UPI003F50E45D